MNIERFMGWSLVHSVWEGALIAAVLACGLLLLKRASAQARYLAAIVALLLCIVAPVITATWINREPSLILRTVTTAAANGTARFSEKHPLKLGPSPITTEVVSSTAPTLLSLQDKVEVSFPWIMRLWLVGLLAMCVRLIGGLIMVERLKRRSGDSIAEPWNVVLGTVAMRLGITRPVELRFCHGINSPAVIGAIKATVLFPVSALTHLTTGQVEALLAHELAHVRRHDYLVNLIQSIIETVLFFHPAVWWVSKVAREEREHCCDDLAVHAIGSRYEYACALASLEGARYGWSSLSMAGSGGSLVTRIKRILGVRPASGARFGGFYPATLVLTLALTIAISAGLARSFTVPKTPGEDSSHRIMVKGRVLDDLGKPVAGAFVLCRMYDVDNPQIGTQNATTDPEGRFTLSAKETDACEFIAAKLGNGFSESNFEPTKLTNNLTLRLTKTRRVSAVVTDVEGHPVSGLRLIPRALTLLGSDGLDSFAKTTDKQGVAVFPDFPANWWLAFTSADPKYSVVEKGTQNADGMPSHRPGQDRIALIAESSASLKGRVTLEGRPIANAMVAAYVPNSEFDKLAITDANGGFEMNGFPGGVAQVHVKLPKLLRHEWVAQAWEAELSPGGTVSIDVKLTRGGLITGHVSGQGGRPANAINVEALAPYGGASGKAGHTGRDEVNPVKGGPNPREVAPYGLVAAEITDENGHFELRVPDGRYTVRAVDRGQSTQWRSSPFPGSQKVVQVRAGGSGHADLTSPPAGVITAVLVRDESGKPLPNVQVDYGIGQMTQSALRTDADGRATATTDPSSVKQLWFRASWQDEFSSPKVLPVNGRADIVLHKMKLGSVAGKVVDTHGRPIPNASIQLWFDSSEDFMGDTRYLSMPKRQTGMDGTYRIEGLYPGDSVTVDAQDSLHARANSSEIRILAGKTVQIPILTLKPAGTLSGRVVDQLGHPVAGAKVVVETAIGLNSVTDKYGRFSVRRVPVGENRVYIWKGHKETHLIGATGTNRSYTLRVGS